LERGAFRGEVTYTTETKKKSTRGGSIILEKFSRKNGEPETGERAAERIAAGNGGLLLMGKRFK